MYMLQYVLELINKGSKYYNNNAVLMQKSKLQLSVILHYTNI